MFLMFFLNSVYVFLFILKTFIIILTWSNAYAPNMNFWISYWLSFLETTKIKSVLSPNLNNRNLARKAKPT